MGAAAPPPEPSLATAPPPTPAAKAGGGLRAGAVLLALVLAFGAAVMIVAAGDIHDTPTLEEIKSGERAVPADREYFDGSESKRNIVTALTYASGVVGGLAVLAALAFAITGRNGRVIWILTAIAIVLAGVALII
jgi:hypothetical protein